jgi:hypothetical protein
MHHSLRSRLATTAIALLFGGLAAAPAAAQLQVLAHYPLLADVLDATAQNGPITLGGTTPPAQPSNGVCVNGIYLFNAGGQDVRTPAMPTLDTTDFQVEVEFQITALPNGNAPVLMGGNGWRWIGIYVQANGTIGLKYNNSNFTWSSTAVQPGPWYTGTIKFEAGVVQLYLNGGLIHQATLGVLNDGNNKNFTTNDFSNGRSHYGCIRNLVIANDTTLDGAMATRYGAGCPGVAGEPTLTPVGTPQLGSVFLADMTNFDPSSAIAFLAVGFSSTNSPLGALPASLVPFGLAPGCDLLVSGEAMLLMFTTNGTGVFAFPVPASPAFTGQALYLQGASLDNTMPGGVALSNGLALSLGL